MKKNIFSSFIVILGFLLVLLFSTLIITKSKGFYNYSVEKFDLMENVNMTKTEISENYSYIVDYVLGVSKNAKFELPSIDYSKDGAIHFQEVRSLFYLAKYIIVILVVVLIFLFTAFYKTYNNLKPIKNLGISLTIVPIVVALIVRNNFYFFFAAFHRIFFNNDKWLFNPQTDPIITILPEEYFALCGGLIILACIISGLLLWGGYSITSHFKNHVYNKFYK